MKYYYDSDERVCYRFLDELKHPGYAVGDDGSVWTCWRITPNRATGRGTVSSISTQWRRITGTIDRDGYVNVSLKVAGQSRPRYWKVHRLILEAFVGACPDGLECRHLDGCPGNNDLSNIVWGTHLSNEADKRKHGTTNKGERHGNALLTADKVRSIRHKWKTGGYSQNMLAREFGVRRGCIQEIVHNRNWTHVT